MPLRVLHAIRDIPAPDWNRLAGTDHPFTRHEFLATLEDTGCVGAGTGWMPRHLAYYDEHGQLAAAAPLYLKCDSWGEFVFDWSWAQAYERSGRRYYPKLVSAVPFTPATGRRLLARDDAAASRLAEEATAFARELGVSSLHWLFTTPAEIDLLSDAGLVRRRGCQFHWQNAGYADFDDFLSTFTAERRKKVKRERRRVSEAGLTLEVRHGEEITPAQWRRFHQHYRGTFALHGHAAPLSSEFFPAVAAAMPGQVILVTAYLGGEDVAGALCYRSADTLYGRHWGARAHFHSLHFEACYYQGIEYCIKHGLRRFEPGAQGEYKVPRGFLPTDTWSAHWIADPALREAIRSFCEREHEAMNDYSTEVGTLAPYKSRE